MHIITLAFLKQRKIVNTDPVFKDNILNNINVSRYRMESKNPTHIRWEVEDMIYEGNALMSNTDILDTASICAINNVYTEKEWKKYFLPAINKAIKKNNTFVRWMPGDVIKCFIKDGFIATPEDIAIVEYDYATGFGGRDFKNLSICSLDTNGNVKNSWAWANYNKWKLIDNEHRIENIEKVRMYHKEHKSVVPFYISQEIKSLLY